MSRSGPVDRDRDVLAAGVEDLLAQQPVARVGAEAVDRHVPLGEGRQDADHHHVRADLGGLGLGVVEAVAQGVLERGQPVLAELGRGDVDLDVELAELGLEVRARDRLERLGVLQGGVAALVDEVELHLEPGHRVVGVEARLAQHPGEDVQVAPDLLPVPGAVGSGELLCFHLFAHGPTLGHDGRPGTEGSRQGSSTASRARPRPRAAPRGRAARPAARRARSPGSTPGTGRSRTTPAPPARTARPRTRAAPPAPRAPRRASAARRRSTARRAPGRCRGSSPSRPRPARADRACRPGAGRGRRRRVRCRRPRGRPRAAGPTPARRSCRRSPSSGARADRARGDGGGHRRDPVGVGAQRVGQLLRGCACVTRPSRTASAANGCAETS